MSRIAIPTLIPPPPLRAWNADRLRWQARPIAFKIHGKSESQPWSATRGRNPDPSFLYFFCTLAVLFSSNPSILSFNRTIQNETPWTHLFNTHLIQISFAILASTGNYPNTQRLHGPLNSSRTESDLARNMSEKKIGTTNRPPGSSR